MRKGYSLVEIIVTIAVLAILLAAFFPSFISALQSSRTKGAAQTLLADIQLAKTEASRRQSFVFISFSETAWCYGINAGSACDCESNPASCNIGSAAASDFPGTVLTENFPNDTLIFNPVRSTSTAGTATFSSGSGRSYSVRISALGRARICQPDAPSGSLLAC